MRYFTATFLLLILLGFISVIIGESLKPNNNHLEVKYVSPKVLTFNELTPHQQKQVMCLAENIFHEASLEPHDGKVAVAFVTLNRMYSQDFPNNICDVVTQIKHRGVCQFSWYCQGKDSFQSLTKHYQMKYNEILKIATNVYLNYHQMDDPSNGAMFYHAIYVRPIWRKDMTKVAKIGKHIFYEGK